MCKLGWILKHTSKLCRVAFFFTWTGKITRQSHQTERLYKPIKVSVTLGSPSLLPPPHCPPPPSFQPTRYLRNYLVSMCALNIKYYINDKNLKIPQEKAVFPACVMVQDWKAVKQSNSCLNYMGLIQTYLQPQGHYGQAGGLFLYTTS